MDFEKSENTLKLQQLRMQLEMIAFCRINLNKSSESIIVQLESFWLDQCRLKNITPANDFKMEFSDFRSKSLLKFAPETTLEKNEEKAMMTVKKMGFSLPDFS